MSASPGWGGNSYSYAGGNLVNATDPTGLWCKLCSKIAKHAASVAADSAAPAIVIGETVVEIASRGDEAADACASSTSCQTYVAGATVLAGLALSPTPAGVPLVLAGTGMFIAIDTVGCIEGSGVSCGFLVADLVTAGATASGRTAVSLGRWGREPWEEMLQQTSVWGTRAAASRPASGVLAGLSAGVTAVGDYGEGFGGP